MFALANANTVDTEAFKEFVSQIGGSVSAFWPELILGITACALLMVDLIIKRERSGKTTALVACGGTLLSLILVYASMSSEARLLFSGMIAVDSFSTFFKMIILVGTLATIGLTALDKGNDGARMGEYYGILIASVLGMCLMATSTNLIMIYLAVELASLSSYVMVAYRRQSRVGTEASLKYAIYGSVSSGIMLYGMSLLYGMTGTLSVMGLADLGPRLASEAGFGIAVGMVLAGMAYKMAAFPMHFWVPDVYQGAPTPVTAFLSVSSKAAGFAVLLRFMAGIIPEDGIRTAQDALFLDWRAIIAVVAAVTMTMGNFAALFQKNIKRMLGYSSIAHAGYLLMGVAALDATGSVGFRAVAFYLFVYLFTNLGAFAVVILVSNQTGSEEIDGFRGLGSKMKIPALAFAVFVFSLIGMPPTAGFTGKFLLFRAAIEQDLIWLAAVGGINTAVSVYYYFRVLKAMYLEESDGSVYPAPSILGRAMVALMVFPVLWFFFSTSLADWTELLAFVAP